MQHIKRYTLGKAERLKSRKAIEELFKEGKSFTAFPFRVIWKQILVSNNSALQAGFTVGSKFFKKAVNRNRIRRLMKEAYRLQKNSLHSTLQNNNSSLSVFIIYIGKEIPEYSLVVEKIASIMGRLQKIVSENNSTNS